MSEVKIELIRLLKIPLTGITIVTAMLVLGIEVGSVSEIGPDGIKFHPGRMNETTEKREIQKNSDLNVSVPLNAKDTYQQVTESKYSESPSTEGWVYLGSFADGKWIDRLIEISEYLIPEVSKSYVVLPDSIGVRAGKPSFPLYQLKPRIGFANKGDLIKIIAIDPDLGRNRVWAKVQVYPLMKES